MDIYADIDLFFHAYELRFNKALAGDKVDVTEVASAFAASFIEASPLGVVCGNNDEAFRQSIPADYEFYKKIGTTSVLIASKEITKLDEHHLMVKVYWKASYKKKNGHTDQIPFHVIYFLQQLGRDLKIFAYITGNEQKVMKEHGLI